MKPRTKRTSRRRTAAFTLVELLVASSIMLIVGSVTIKMFYDTTEAVRVGIANSHIMENARAAIDQLDRDTDYAYLVGPGDEALLVIVNRTIPNVQFNPRHADYSEDKTPVGGWVRDVASDQILFIVRNSGQVRPVVPANANTYAPDPTLSTTAVPEFARIWLGHGRRTNSNGSRGGGTANSGVGANAMFAHELPLCRQVLFLKYQATPSYTYAVNARADAAVQGGFVADTSFGSSPFGSPQLCDGLADVANWNLKDGTSQATPTAIIGPADSANLYPYLLETNMADATYKAGAYNLMFADTDTVLSVNPSPQLDTTRQLLFQSWQLAQTHPYFIGNVSDFVVEFAADTDNDGEIDRYGDCATLPSDRDARDIIWYHGTKAGHMPDGTTLVPGGDFQANWAGSTLAFGNYNPWDKTPSLAYADAAFVWRHDDDQAYTATAPDNLNNSKWPYLIRIRYRIHDDRNVLTSSRIDTDYATFSNAGRWYEQIFRVRRP